MSKSVEQKVILLLSQQLEKQRGFGAHEDLLLTYERVIDQRRRAYEKRWGKPVGKPRK
ncbi:hypothetical protein [Caulifigura coniformis]|nr:hypothetical protein [Caulifigura coniformis]